MKQYQFNAGARHCARERGAWAPTFMAASRPHHRELRGTLKRFVDECCVIGPQAVISAADLYQAFERWATTTGKAFIMLPHNFEERLSAAGWLSERSARGDARWVGIAVRQPN